ncbi:hypothetical protein AB3S75_017947 [Citrus x aurantiifolia]
MPPKSTPRTTERTSSKFWMPSGFMLACLLAFTLQIFFSLPPVSSDSLLPMISTFQGLIKLGEGVVNYPEDVAVDRNGVVYTATSDGWIMRLQNNETWENWKLIHSQTLLGITATKEKNNLIVCDSDKGLLKVSENGVTVLASHVTGSKLRFTNDVIEASDGSLYITVSSTKFAPKAYYLDLVEGEPHGQLLRYDPSSKQASIVLEGLYFANGVALSKHGDFVVVCESWKFRCIKHWLKLGDKRDREIFIENLPGGPDNINLAPDGSFWISLIKMNSSAVETVHSSKNRKQLLEEHPELMNQLMSTGKGAAANVVKVSANGSIIREFNDPNAKNISFVTSALEFHGNLYLASINSNFIGKLPLK